MNAITARTDATDHLPLVRAIARNIHRRLPKEVDVDDLIGEGTVGLLAATRGFAASHGVTFEQYARIRIQGAILDSLRARDWVPRSVRTRALRVAQATAAVRERTGSASRAEIASELELSEAAFERYETLAEVRTTVSLDSAPSEDGLAPIDTLACDEADGLERLVSREQRQAVIAAIEALPERDRTVISLYYLRGLSLKEIGRVIGVTESRVCQLRGEAIRKLQGRLAGLFGEERRTVRPSSRSSAAAGKKARSARC